MKKLTLAHAEAVSAAKLNMIRIADGANSPGFKRHIELMIDQLGEVSWWILNGIYHPGLPFNQDPTGPGLPEPEKPQDNGTASRQD